MTQADTPTMTDEQMAAALLAKRNELRAAMDRNTAALEGVSRMTVTLRHRTTEELACRRSEILGQLGVSEPDVLSRADVGDLSRDEWDLVDELERINYLLG